MAYLVIATTAFCKREGFLNALHLLFSLTMYPRADECSLKQPAPIERTDFGLALQEVALSLTFLYTVPCAL